MLVNNESLWDKIYQERFGDGGGDISSKKLGKAAMVFAKNLPPTARGKLKYMLKLNEEKCVQCGNIFYEVSRGRPIENLLLFVIFSLAQIDAEPCKGLQFPQGGLCSKEPVGI